jgi:hypothetical protein
MSTVETVADQLVGDLARMGVQRIYGLVGDSLNPISDAVRRAGPADRGGIDRGATDRDDAADCQGKGGGPTRPERTPHPEAGPRRGRT